MLIYVNYFDIKYLKVSIEYKKVNKTDIDALYKINLKGSQECVITLEPIDFFLKKNKLLSFKKISPDTSPESYRARRDSNP